MQMKVENINSFQVRTWTLGNNIKRGHKANIFSPDKLRQTPLDSGAGRH